MQRLRIVFAMFLACTAISCGHDYNSTGFSPRGGAPVTDENAAAPAAAFSMQDWRPVDIVIPDVEGLRGTAFVVSESSPSGVVAVDIDSRPMKRSQYFAGMENPRYGSAPKSLAVLSEDEAFLLTESQIIAFNPARGYIYSATSAIEHVDIGGGHRDSQGNAAAARIYPGIPSDIAVSGRRIFVSSPNYKNEGDPSAANPGVIQVFEIGPDRRLAHAGFAVTSCFNPTSVAARNANEIVVVNSGTLDFSNRDAAPSSPSCVDIMDAATLSVIRSIDLGMTGAFSKKPAISFDGSRGFVGSAVERAIYEADFLNGRAIRGAANPIVLAGAGGFVSDALLSSDNATLFAVDFSRGALMSLDLSLSPPVQLGQINIGAAPAGASDGGGSLAGNSAAVRPGTRGEDFDAEDIYAISRDTGEIVAINSGRPAVRPGGPTRPEDIPQDEDPSGGDTGDGGDSGGAFSPPPSVPPPPPPEGDDSDPCQGYAQRVSSFTAGAGSGFGMDHLPDIVLGPPRGAGSIRGSGDVLSLGRNGQIVLDLGNCRVTDGPGADFIVFENAFLIGGDPLSPYKELGAVGVSENGVTFVEFSCEAISYPYAGCAGWHAVYSNPTNAISPFDAENAGGDPFDLSEIGISEARYIRIRDLEGDGLGTTSGFDLDAVSVVNGVIR